MRHDRMRTSDCCKVTNEYITEGDTTIIRIRCFRGVFDCLIDTDDIGKAKEWKWTIHKQGYICGHRGGHQSAKLHRLVMNADDSPGLVVDHIHHNRLDNRKSELRLVTRRLNNLNRKSIAPTANICQNRNGKWIVYFTVNYIRQTFGVYETQEEATIVAAAIRRRHIAGEIHLGRKIRPPKSGTSCVYKNRQGKWYCHPQINHKRTYLGCFATKKEAEDRMARFWQDHPDLVMRSHHLPPSMRNAS